VGTIPWVAGHQLVVAICGSTRKPASRPPMLRQGPVYELSDVPTLEMIEKKLGLPSSLRTENATAVRYRPRPIRHYIRR
jgi:hypothetical protein